jgi:hypothetical protein
LSSGNHTCDWRVDNPTIRYAFNSNAVLAENSTYTNASLAGWRVPTSIVTARFAKISAQFDF